MAKNSIRDYDATSGNNTDVQSVDISEGCAASGINNAIREVMADLKDVSTGTVNLETPAADRLDVDNIRIDGNTISSTDTNGDINLIPNGTGEVVFHSIADSDNYVQVSSANNSEAGIRFRGDSSLGTGTDIGYEGNGNRFFISTVSGGTATERVSMDSSGNVGIGTSSPDQTLHVHKGSAGSASSSSAAAITIEHSSDTSLQFLTPAANSQEIRFGDPGNNGAGRLSYDHGINSMKFHTNGSESMRIDSNGKLRIGTDSILVDNAILNCQMSAASGTVAAFKRNYTSNARSVSFVNPNGEVGTINTNGSSTSYNTSSDHRLKENVVDMTGAIDRVKALAPKRFNFIADADTTVDGFLAHEAQTVVPEAVTGTHNEVDDDGNAVMQGIDQAKLVPLLTAALKESIAKIETLETEMTALKARVTALEA